MKKIKLLLLLLPLVSYGCSNHRKQDNLPIPPSDSLINEVIYSVIQLDSLQTDYDIGKHLFIPIVYDWIKLSTPPPPPPPSHYEYSFGEISSFFHTNNDINKRIKDSVFVLQQIDTTLNHMLLKNVSDFFKNIVDETYYFSIPVFDINKKIALVQYNLSLQTGYQTVLEFRDRKWIKVDHKIGTNANSDDLIKCLRQRQDRFVINPNIYALKFCSIYKMLWHPDSFVSLDSIIGAVGRPTGALFFART